MMAQNQAAGLEASEKAVKAIHENVTEVIMPFPGGVCRSGSKAGSRKYKLKASTNDPFCPTIRGLVENSHVPENAESVYEIVINGLNLDAVKNAMAEGIKAAVKVPGIIKITAGNYGGKLGPYHVYLKEILDFT